MSEAGDRRGGSKRKSFACWRRFFFSRAQLAVSVYCSGMKIIGITGTIGAGKGAAVEYLKSKGFEHFSAREFLIREIAQRGLPVVRDTMHEVATDLRKRFDSAYIVHSLYKEAAATGRNCVIESIRAVGEVELLKKQPDFVLLAVDADIRLRYDRIVARGSSTDHITFDKFVEDERKEMSSADPAGMNIAECMRRADYVIENNGTLEELHGQLDRMMGQAGILPVH